MIPNIRHHWSTPIAKYKNVKLAEKLKDYILTLNAEGIESGVAPVIKHNLVESKFNFYKTDEPVIHDTVKWLSECISVTVKALNPDHKVNYKINFIDSETLEIKIAEKFIGERGRINCSLKEKDNFWRWLGIQYVISDK